MGTMTAEIAPPRSAHGMSFARKCAVDAGFIIMEFAVADQLELFEVSLLSWT